MKKEMHYQFKRVMAMVLAAAMVLTSVPQAKLTVYAAENEVSEETSADTDNREDENKEGEVQETEGNNEASGEEEGVGQDGNSESDNSDQGAEGESGDETTDETGESVDENKDETGEFGDENTDEADESAEGDQENEEEERLQAEDTEEENTNQEGKDYTFTFSADEHTKIYDESGENQIDKMTVPVGLSDTLSFKVVVEDGYVIRSVTASGKGSNGPRINGRYTTGIYRIMPQKSGYTSDAVITVRSALREDHTATITYDSSAVVLYVMKGDESAA